MERPRWLIVVLDCPYRTWSRPITQRLFAAIVDLKLRAYQAVHGYGVLPVDSYDYIGTHYLVCDAARPMAPVMGFKSVSLERCAEFKQPLPIYPLLHNSRTTRHAAAVDKLLQKCQGHSTEIFYDSTWAMDPTSRSRRAIRQDLHELFISMIVHKHALDPRFELLGCGVPRFRTDKFFEKLGYRRLPDDEQELPSFAQASLLNEHSVLLHLQKFSEKALSIAARYREAWDQRIVL